MRKRKRWPKIAALCGDCGVDLGRLTVTRVFYCDRCSWIRNNGDPLDRVKLQGDGPHRITERVELIPFTTCWLWMGAEVKPTGYGSLCVNMKTRSAHRYSYEKFNGHIPKGMQVMHACHNKLCVNPSHLSLGTQLENEAQKKAAGRQAVGEKNGWSKLTSSQVLEIREDDRKLKLVAMDYFVSETTISSIRRRKTWGHL